MKNLVAGFLGMTLLFSASLGWATYVILLKDGRAITTHEYWEEGDQIKIKQFGGVVGIAKKNVIRIEEADDVKTLVVKSPSENSPEEANEKSETDQRKENKEAKKDKSVDVNERPQEPDKGKASKEKNPLLKEFDALKKKFEKVEDMTKQEISQFDRALRDLRNKIIKAGLAGPYANQMVEIFDMGNKAEEVYKKRDQ
ncbi:MAG: hypothetical protein K9N10_02140 [Deltaproteobacteria bacterium]|nr:hypothetical protein [Deltaproteobacteria bacterium]